ncbi:MAG: SPOR domain-containing protein [Candidatus Latescibacteria bacterium]|nr:SPOR domain-containing protein [Candidatus Latescibacterota bacterium]
MRRNRPNWRSVFVLGLSLTGLSGTFAEVRAQQGAGTYAAPFLKIPVGARLMSSPDVVAGLAPDATVMYANPAFLAGLPRGAAFVTTSEWLDNLTFTSAGFALPIGSQGTVLGVGATFLYSGGVQGYDAALNPVSEESFYDMGLDLTVSHAFRGTGLALAAGTTIIREHVLPTDGSGYAFHLGASYWMGPNLFHAAARDLGGTVSFDSESWSVAPEYSFGGGRIFASRLGQFFAGAQFADSDAYGTRLQLGVDYQFNPTLTLRSGFTENMDNEQRGAPFNAGFGLHYGVMTLDYAYTPQEYFSSVHTFSLSYTFGGPKQGTRAMVPTGDLAPPIADSEPVPPPSRMAVPKEPSSSTGGSYVLLAGSHAWLESARAEVRALQLLQIPAKIESNGSRYRVVVGRFTSDDAAEKARREYASAGHAFTILAE